MAKLPPVNVGKFASHAEQVRTLLARTGTGTLSTLAREPAGYPFGSLVHFALDPQAHPVLLISQLAEHTRNLDADPRASLLVVESLGEVDPLSCGRVTLLGEAERVEDRSQVRDLYLDRHPDSRLYADFKDFAFFRLRVRSVRFVGGFGRMSWVPSERYREARPDPLIPAALGILQHMNEDHREALRLMVRHQAQLEAEAARMVEVDRYGFTLEVTSSEGVRHVRLGFPEAVLRPDQVRQAMVQLVGEARAALGA